ncbi:MAG: hypothetical protein P4L74_06550 [Candidatus Doudnabacteria bacterium]|nr:hypothetical protein [Candidatus Doudnabacteria bacterium]
MRFSEGLIGYTKEHFNDKHHKLMTDDEANSATEALADLFLLMAKRQAAGRPHPNGGAAATPPVILD